MRILFSITNLEVGGAQKFVIHLASALAEQNEVFIYDQRPEDRSRELVSGALSPKVKVLSYASHPFLLKLTWKIDKTFKKLGIAANFRDKLNLRSYHRAVQKGKFDVIHSHLSLSDHIVCANHSGKQPHVVITLHGCYDKDAAVENDPYVNASISNIPLLMKNASAIIYLAEKSLQPFREKHLPAHSVTFSKISNALFHKGSISGDKTAALEQAFGIGENSFVFGMVGRGIKEKGWKEALEAFLAAEETLKKKNIHPVFIAIGAGKFLSGLREKYASEKNIHFTGEVPDPMNYMAVMNAGLLPSYRECFPNVIMEYIQLGIPVLSTDVGDVRNMIAAEDGKSCGMLIPSNADGSPVVDELSNAMTSLAMDKELHADLSATCLRTRGKFSIEACVNNHIQLYRQVSKK